MAKIQARLLKGFRDYDPKEQAARQAMFAKIQTVFERFGFLPLSTPALEYKDILIGKYGEEERLIYSFQDKGEREVALRYDLTVPLARYVAQNQNKLTFPFKRYQIAPVWRAENTQKGRSREFYQCDIDVVGTESPLADAEVMACMCKALEELGIKNYELRINDRRNFDVLGEEGPEIIRSIDKFDKIGLEKVVEELKQKGIEADKIGPSKAFMDGTAVLEYNTKLIELRDQTINLGVPKDNIKIDPTIARGLDYYTSTVFEIVLSDKPEFGSIVGGGRYDGLVDQFSDKSLPAVGGSIGIDRLFEAMEDLGLRGGLSLIKALVLNLDQNLQNDYVKLAADLRSAGIGTELYFETAKLDKQFKYAESKGIAYAVIMGLEEKQKGIAQVKDLKTREQKECKLDDLTSILK